MSDDIDYPHEYDNSGRVANSAQLIDNYITDAALYREQDVKHADYDVSYGPEERNKYDIFWPDDENGHNRKSPIVLFIHGGYWQRLDRKAFSHLANGLNQRGAAVAMPSYTLCPDISIDGIVTEMRRVCLVLYQKYRRRLRVVGHSAGGHLAACLLATNWKMLHRGLPNDLVAAGLGISGIYDLVPITRTPVNDAVRMTPEQAVAASPVRWLPEALSQFDAWVGAEESNEYHRQSRELADKWCMLGTPTRYVSVPGANHFTIVEQLQQPDSPMVERIVELILKPAIDVELAKPDEEAVAKLMGDDYIPPIEEASEAEEPATEQETATSTEESTSDKAREREPQDTAQSEQDESDDPSGKAEDLPAEASTDGSGKSEEPEEQQPDAAEEAGEAENTDDADEPVTEDSETDQGNTEEEDGGKVADSGSKDGAEDKEPKAEKPKKNATKSDEK